MPTTTTSKSSDRFTVPTKSCEDFGYVAQDTWAQVPAGWSWAEVTAVAVDRQDRVFVFNRGEHPVMVFDQNGKFLRSWGEGVFTRPHGIFIGPDDAVYCTDDLGHTVQKFTPEGRLLFTLGTRGKPSETGSTSIDFRTIVRAGEPFNYPTNLALSPTGDLYISDGYGNARVHKFSAEGQLLFSWGEPGNGPGQFRVPHGIAVDREGIVYVADRENSRIQLFSPDGKFLTEWTNVVRPCQLCITPGGDIFVAELGFRAGMWPGTHPPFAEATGGCLSILDAQGEVKARWGGGVNPCAPGDFFAPHDVRVDSRGDLYVSEVVMSAGGNRGLVDPTCHSLQKFVRKSAR